MARGAYVWPCVLLLSGMGLGPVLAFRHQGLDGLENEGSLAGHVSQHSGALSLKSHLSSGIDLNIVSQVMQLGIEGVEEGIASLQQDPFDLQASLEIFDRNLWKIIELVVPAEQQASPDFEKARVAWDAAFHNLPKIQEITADIMKYRDTGDTDALTRAMEPILSAALQSCAQTYPEVAAYFQSVEELLDGIFESWGMFAEGKTAEAVEMVWNAVKKALEDILPADMNTDGNVQFVMDTIDGVIGKLSAHVLEYKRRVLNSKVCYKRTTKREKVRPSVCREGFEWDQMNLCKPTKGNGAPCLSTCGDPGMCPSFCGKGKACCKRDDSRASPECVGATGYVDSEFTKGSSRDYHQCVAPGPALQYEIKRCGEPRANGLWVQNGKQGGRPRYTKVGDKKTIIEWSSSKNAWRLFTKGGGWFGTGSETLYESKADEAVLPLAGWELVSGLYPVPTVSKYAASEMSLVEENATVTRWGDDDFGSHESLCDVKSAYPEKVGLWCYGECADGYMSKDSSCEQICGGTFPAEGKLGVCGHNPGELALATTEMLSILANSAVKFVDIVDKVSQDGVKADHLSNTVHTFIDLGKPFARPTCPEDMMSEASSEPKMKARGFGTVRRFTREPGSVNQAGS